jgi:hypothetical protein
MALRASISPTWPKLPWSTVLSSEYRLRVPPKPGRRGMQDLGGHPVEHLEQTAGDLAQVLQQLSGAERGHVDDLGPGVALGRKQRGRGVAGGLRSRIDQRGGNRAIMVKRPDR